MEIVVLTQKKRLEAVAGRGELLQLSRHHRKQ